jgi:hypothetical protein
VSETPIPKHQQAVLITAAGGSEVLQLGTVPVPGGFGSGRHRGKPTVESGLTLDLNRLIRRRDVLPGEHVSGSLVWTSTRTGEQSASIGYEASLVNPEAAWVRLFYAANNTPKNYRVQLETTPCHYGGTRWWWLCPLSGRRAAKLYLPPGATVFAAREFYRLAYRSQRETAINRMQARQVRLYRKLAGEDHYFGQSTPPRPVGMHGKTYARLIAELEAAKDAHEAAFIAGASAILDRISRIDGRLSR